VNSVRDGFDSKGTLVWNEIDGPVEDTLEAIKDFANDEWACLFILGPAAEV